MKNIFDFFHTIFCYIFSIAILLIVPVSCVECMGSKPMTDWEKATVVKVISIDGGFLSNGRVETHVRFEDGTMQYWSGVWGAEGEVIDFPRRNGKWISYFGIFGDYGLLFNKEPKEDERD